MGCGRKISRRRDEEGIQEMPASYKEVKLGMPRFHRAKYIRFVPTFRVHFGPRMISEELKLDDAIGGYE
jgi:hypothetical protein